MNNLGYRLVGMKRLEHAIEIFKLNVESYPQSANAYDSLAETYMMNGNKELAIKNYERSLRVESGEFKRCRDAEEIESEVEQS